MIPGANCHSFDRLVNDHILQICNVVKPGLVKWLMLNSDYFNVIPEIQHKVRIALTACVIINPKTFNVSC